MYAFDSISHSVGMCDELSVLRSFSHSHRLPLVLCNVLEKDLGLGYINGVRVNFLYSNEFFFNVIDKNWVRNDKFIHSENETRITNVSD